MKGGTHLLRMLFRHPDVVVVRQKPRREFRMFALRAGWDLSRESRWCEFRNTRRLLEWEGADMSGHTGVGAMEIKRHIC